MWPQNLVEHDHSVLKAFSPVFAGQYLMRNKSDGWKSLGGILLAFTGVEALFADLGAFSRRAIQISWFCFAYPCLLLAVRPIHFDISILLPANHVASISVRLLTSVIIPKQSRIRSSTRFRPVCFIQV